MKIYTKSGDDGTTGLYAGPRVRKDSPRIEANGAVDELNALLGVARAAGAPPHIDALLNRIQNELFDLGAEISSPNTGTKAELIGDAHIAALEREIDAFEAELAPLKQFILPGGTPAAAALHLVRTVGRRAERRLITLAHTQGEIVAPRLLTYLNRLSDWLFVLARAANATAGVPDVPWVKAGDAGRTSTTPKPK